VRGVILQVSEGDHMLVWVWLLNDKRSICVAWCCVCAGLLISLRSGEHGCVVRGVGHKVKRPHEGMSEGLRRPATHV
jgi:hypothetical protein